MSQHAPMRVATPDGVCVSVGEWGNPAGPEILFIPGLAQSVLSFNRQTDSALARDFRIIAYDLRGHGLSDKPTDPACYQDGKRWADEVHAVIAAKRLRRPVLVGWSLGGRVLRQYLMHYGDGALSGINFLASRPIEDPSIVGPASKAMQNDTSRDLAGRIATSVAFLRACYEKQPDEADFITAVAYNFMLPFEIRDAIGGWATDPDGGAQGVRRHHGADARHAWPARQADPAGRRRDDRGGDQGRDRLVLRRLRSLAVLRGRRALQSRACGVRREGLERARWMTTAVLRRGAARARSRASACSWRQAPPRWSSPRS